MNIKWNTISNIMSTTHIFTENLFQFIYIYKKRFVMPWMFICSHYIQQFYDTVATAIIGRNHRQWLMTHLTAPLPQNKLSLLQQSATFIKITLKLN